MNFDVRRPALLTLPVRDLKRSLAFWHDALGVPIKLRSPGIAELQTEGIVIVLVETPDTFDSPAIGPRLAERSPSLVEPIRVRPLVPVHIEDCLRIPH